MIHRPLIAVTGLVALLVATDALALPRYSAQYGQRCALCHVDPAGGGMRTQYASMALVPLELSHQQLDDDQLDAIRPDLSPAVTVGLDLRTLVIQGEGGEGRQVDMQGDVTVAVTMSPRLTAYVNLGKGGTQEFAALAHVLPHNGYLKFGRITPDYGWRWADHTMAARRYLLDENGVTSPAALTDAGLEAGLHGQHWEVSGSLLGGGGDNGESFAGRMAWRQEFGPVRAALGTSVLRRQQVGGRSRAVGAFGYLSAGPASWVFQVDETGNDRREGLLISQELTYRLVRGIHARGVYTYHDPDHQLTTGTRNRWSLGCDSLLNPFFGVQIMASYHHIRPGELVRGRDHWQAEMVLHVLY